MARDEKMLAMIGESNVMIESLNKDLGSKHTSNANQPFLVYLLGGIVIGSIISMVMMGFVNQGAFGKKRRLSPSKGGSGLGGKADSLNASEFDNCLTDGDKLC